jgi:hypothetical protein
MQLWQQIVKPEMIGGGSWFMSQLYAPWQTLLLHPYIDMP